MTNKGKLRKQKMDPKEETLILGKSADSKVVSLVPERLQIQLSPTVISSTKIRAVQDRTTASTIVEAALRAYLKL